MKKKEKFGGIYAFIGLEQELCSFVLILFYIYIYIHMYIYSRIIWYSTWLYIVLWTIFAFCPSLYSVIFPLCEERTNTSLKLTNCQFALHHSHSKSIVRIVMFLLCWKYLPYLWTPYLNMMALYSWFCYEVDITHNSWRDNSECEILCGVTNFYNLSGCHKHGTKFKMKLSSCRLRNWNA